MTIIILFVALIANVFEFDLNEIAQKQWQYPRTSSLLITIVLIKMQKRKKLAR